MDAKVFKRWDLPEQPGTWSITTVSAMLFGLHTSFSFMLGSMPVPFGFTLLLAVTLLIGKSQKISLKLLMLLIALLGLGLVASFTGPPGQLSQRLSSTLYFTTSLFIAIVLYLELKTWPLETLRRYFLIVALTLIIGAALEILTPLQYLSDAFRQAILIKHNLYDGDLRDILQTGIVRPKLFSVEPSILAHSIGIISLAWLATAYRDPLRLVKFTGLIFAALFVVRSPSLFVFYPPAVFYCYMSRQPGETGTLFTASRLLTLLIVGSLGAGAIFFIGQQVMGGRIDNILSGTDTSMLVRLVVPEILTYKVLSAYPLFGMGVGGKNFISTMTQYAILAVGANVSKFAAGGGDTQLFSVSFLEYWASYGLLGGSLGVYILRRIQVMLAPGDGMPILVSILCISLAGDYFAGSYFWGYVGILVAVGHGRWRDAALARNPATRPPNRVVAVQPASPSLLPYEG